MAVGAFPGLDPKRMTIRAPANEYDKTTLVSILPKKLPPEIKPTIQPGRFEIPYGTFEQPGVLVIGPSSWWKETDVDAPLLEIPHSSLTVAHSVVRDCIVGMLACDMGETRPGIFYVPGVVTSEELKKEQKYIALLEQYNKYQKNWFAALVKMADVLWARTNGNPLTISDDMKLAAEQLSLKDKPWLKDFISVQMANCVACGALRNPLYPVCPNCKAVDKAQAEKLGIAFAKV